MVKPASKKIPSKGLPSKKIPSEHQEQALFVQWARRKGLPIFAIPNGGARHIAVAMKLKLEGVRPGVPDLFLPLAVGKYHGLFVEMKRQKGGSVSGEQKEWHKLLIANGYEVIIGYGAESAKEQTLLYLQDKSASAFSQPGAIGRSCV